MTGGSGLLGTDLVERLRHRYRVVVLDTAGDPESPSDVEFICTDLTSSSSVQRAVKRVAGTYGHHLASVVHLAAYYDFSGEPSPRYDEVTVEGTKRLLEALDSLAVDQFVFSSTMLVHEPTEPGEPIDATDPLDPSWPYPESKVETEQLIRAHEGPGAPERVVIARLAGVYDEAGHSPPIVNQIRRIDGGWITSRFYPADLDRGQAFVHRDDAVDALARIVDRRDDLPSRTALLIGEPRTYGYGEIQNAIGRTLYGTAWTTLRVPAPVAKLGAWIREKNPFGDDPFVRPWMVDRAGDHYELDIAPARELLEWEPQHRVIEVIGAMVERLRKDRDAWYRANGLQPPRRRRR